MSRTERRTSSRKACSLPVRFHLDLSEREVSSERAAESARAQNSECIGKALNLSERGVYFICYEKLSAGQPIALYMTLPTELTGRAPESVRCSARVVRVDQDGHDGLRGIGACVEQFEFVAAVPDRGSWKSARAGQRSL